MIFEYGENFNTVMIHTCITVLHLRYNIMVSNSNCKTSDQRQKQITNNNKQEKETDNVISTHSQNPIPFGTISGTHYYNQTNTRAPRTDGLKQDMKKRKKSEEKGGSSLHFHSLGHFFPKRRIKRSCYHRQAGGL
jgi:hypothetical protein